MYFTTEIVPSVVESGGSRRTARYVTWTGLVNRGFRVGARPFSDPNWHRTEDRRPHQKRLEGHGLNYGRPRENAAMAIAARFFWGFEAQRGATAKNQVFKEKQKGPCRLAGLRVTRPEPAESS